MSLVMFGGLGDKQGAWDTLGTALCAQGISWGICLETSPEDL